MISPKKLLSLLSCMILPSVHAADFNPIWEPLTSQLQSFQMIAPVDVLNMNQGRQFASDSPYQLDFLNQNTNNIRPNTPICINAGTTTNNFITSNLPVMKKSPPFCQACTSSGVASAVLFNCNSFC